MYYYKGQAGSMVSGWQLEEPTTLVEDTGSGTIMPPVGSAEPMEHPNHPHSSLLWVLNSERVITLPPTVLLDILLKHKTSQVAYLLRPSMSHSCDITYNKSDNNNNNHDLSQHIVSNDCLISLLLIAFITYTTSSLGGHSSVTGEGCIK